MNSLQFQPLFVFLRVDFSHFSPFEGEFFAIFALWGWILCIFHLFSVNFFAIFTFLRRILCLFYPFRMNSFQFSTFKGYFSDWGFSIWNSACVLFCHKSPVFFWVICWHFLSFKRVFFTIFTFLAFFGMKMDKKFSCNGECFKILIFV